MMASGSLGSSYRHDVTRGGMARRRSLNVPYHGNRTGGPDPSGLEVRQVVPTHRNVATITPAFSALGIVTMPCAASICSGAVVGPGSDGRGKP
jgi:hypothetical protein